MSCVGGERCGVEKVNAHHMLLSVASDSLHCASSALAIKHLQHRSKRAEEFHSLQAARLCGSAEEFHSPHQPTAH